ncbi:MAG: hypothetical protein MJ153_00825 [Clostridia bacterium]|nr:hypothetical protein [Clostridia bacterium]
MKNKRVIALISAVMMLSLTTIYTSCKASDNTDSTEQSTVSQEKEVSAEVSSDEIPEETVNNIDETVVGHIDGNIYINEDLGFDFNGNDRFILTGYEEFIESLAENTEISEFVMRNGVAVILNAESKESKETNIQISIMSDAMSETVFVDETICQQFLEIMGSSDDIKMSEAVQLDFAGQKIWAAHIVYNEGSAVPEYYQSYFMMNGKVLSLTIDVYSEGQDINEICSFFTKHK